MSDQPAEQSAEQAVTFLAIDPATDPRFVTADRVRITDGIRCWDYDLRPVVINFRDTYRFGNPNLEQYWDGWFSCRYADGGYAGIMNGERLVTRHPATGQSADEAFDAERSA